MIIKWEPTSWSETSKLAQELCHKEQKNMTQMTFNVHCKWMMYLFTWCHKTNYPVWRVHKNQPLHCLVLSQSKSSPLLKANSYNTCMCCCWLKDPQKWIFQKTFTSRKPSTREKSRNRDIFHPCYVLYRKCTP